ncbi:hypothetical protein ACFQZT_19330, partial [Paenibacillus sp. GCM10027628]
AKLATKVQIGNVDDVIAAGDTDAYVPIIAYDAAGNQLSADDIVSTENQSQIRISASTGTGYFSLETVGSHKGQIHLTNIPAQKNGSISVSAFIATSNVSSSDTKNFTVQAARIPDHIKEATAPGKQLLPGGSTGFQYTVIDQYGKRLDTFNRVDSNGNVVTSGGNSYSVTVTARTYTPQYNTATPPVFTGYASAPDSNVSVGTNLNGATPMLITADNDAVVNDAGSKAVFASSATAQAITDVKAFNGNTYRFAAANVTTAKNYKTDLVVTIWKNGTDEINKITRTATVADSASTNFTYSVNSVATLWNAKDSGVVTTAVYVPGVTVDGTDNDTASQIGKSTQLKANSKFGREVTISVKNAAGEVVGLPKRILSISSSDTNVANVLQVSSSDGVNTTNGIGKAYVIGNKAGTATLAISFVAADGSTKTLTTPVTVKSDALAVSNVTWDDKGYNEGLAFNAFTNLNVTDNYGKTFEDGDALHYNYLLGVTFSVSNVSAGATVTVDQFGNVKVTGSSSATFDLTATSATGKTATTTIYASSSTTTRTVH